MPPIRIITSATRIHIDRATAMNTMLWSLRSLGATVAPDLLYRSSRDMGQELFEPPDVSGWDEEEAWINSATWIHRHNFANRVSDEGLYPQLDQLVPVTGASAELKYLLGLWFPEGISKLDQQRLQDGAHRLAGADRTKRLALLMETILMLPAAHRF